MLPFDFLSFTPMLATNYIKTNAKLTSLNDNCNFHQMENMENILCPEFIPTVCDSGWFYTNENNQAVGTINTSNLQQLYFQKIINPHTYVFNYNHRPNWFRICDFEPLHQLLHDFQTQTEALMVTAETEIEETEIDIETETETEFETETVQSKPILYTTDTTQSLKHKIENIWSDLSSSSPSSPQMAIDSNYGHNNDRLVSFDDSSLKLFSWNINPNECERFRIRFDPLCDDFDFKIMLKEHQKRKNETEFRLLHKNMTDLKLKNKIDSLLNYINCKLSKEDEKLSIECYSKQLMEKIKQIFKYHIYDNKEILFGRDNFTQFCIKNNIDFDAYYHKLHALEETVIEEWRNKLFAAISLDVFYENVIKRSSYGIVYSLNRLSAIIKNKMNYFLVARTYFAMRFHLPLIKITVTSSKIIEPIKFYQVGSRLKGANFASRPSWIEIYFSSKYSVDNKDKQLQSINNGFMDYEQVMHFGDIIGEIKYILNDHQIDIDQEYDEIQKHDMMRLWIENEDVIMSHPVISCINSEDESDWQQYIESGVERVDILYVMEQFRRIKRKFILETPKRFIKRKHEVSLKQKPSNTSMHIIKRKRKVSLKQVHHITFTSVSLASLF